MEVIFFLGDVLWVLMYFFYCKNKNSELTWSYSANQTNKSTIWEQKYSKNKCLNIFKVTKMTFRPMFCSIYSIKSVLSCI